MKFGVAIILTLALSPSLYADDIEQDIRLGLSMLLPEVEVSDIKATPINGIYQVILGPDVIYMTADGRYVFKGDLLDINERRNLTEDVRSENRVGLLNSLKKDEYIEFAASSPSETIYVFTDIDCGYCRKLHQDVPELNNRGVTVRYLAYPRAGVNSATGREMESVWCADNKQEALTRAKNNESVESKSCANSPIARQYDLGKQLGVRGTPAIYLEDGQAIPGYMPPDRLIKSMQQQ